jgi:hypothetical protein
MKMKSKKIILNIQILMILISDETYIKMKRKWKFDIFLKEEKSVKKNNKLKTQELWK